MALPYTRSRLDGDYEINRPTIWFKFSVFFHEDVYAAHTDRSGGRNASDIHSYIDRWPPLVGSLETSYVEIGKFRRLEAAYFPLILSERGWML